MYMYMCIHVYAYTCVHMYTCNVCVYTCVYMHMCDAYVHIHICAYACAYENYREKHITMDCYLITVWLLLLVWLCGYGQCYIQDFYTIIKWACTLPLAEVQVLRTLNHFPRYLCPFPRQSSEELAVLPRKRDGGMGQPENLGPDSHEHSYHCSACMHGKWIQSCPTLCDPMTEACQAPLSMRFSR